MHNVFSNTICACYGVNSSSSITEVKSGSVSNAAINECYFNIFGCAFSLVTIQLQMGNIVQGAEEANKI